MREPVSKEDGHGRTAGRKLLSICIAGRNDDYGGNFRYRIETALNHMAKNAAELDLLGLMEVVVCDWNSEQKLGDAIKLSPEARQIVHFVYVPPEIAEPLNPVNTCFNNSLSVNAAIRRAEGNFIMCMPADILFSRASMKNLTDLLQHKTKAPIDIDRTLMQIHRKFIPWQFLAREPDIDAIDDFLFHNSWKFRIEIFDSGLNSGMGAFVMRRRLFHECRGIDEGLGKWGWSDIELGLRINQRYPSAILSHLGIYCYEMDIKKETRVQTIQEKNPQTVSKTLETNTADWGMADRELEIYVPTDRCLPQSAGTRKGITKAELFRDMKYSPVKSLIVGSFGEEAVNSNAWPSMFLLAWYTHSFKPQTFVDYLILAGFPSLVVPFIYPCITYIGIDCCYNESSGARINSVIQFLDNTLGFKGRFHFLSGDINSSFNRLSETVKLYEKYDLIHFLPDLFPDTYINELEYMIQYIPDHGAIILTTNELNYLHEIKNWLTNRNEFLVINSPKNRVGIIIRDVAWDPTRCRNSCFEEDTEAAYFDSILM